MLVCRRAARRCPGHPAAAASPAAAAIRLVTGRRFAAAASLAAVLAATAPLAAIVAVEARAESVAVADRTAAVQSTLYFGLKTRDGVGVSEQQWAAFLAAEVTPRFPGGLTVLSAYGQGGGPGADAVLAEFTKVLIIVHPADAAAAAKISEIKAIYTQKFDPQGVFHTEADVRIVP